MSRKIPVIIGIIVIVLAAGSAGWQVYSSSNRNITISKNETQPASQTPVASSTGNSSPSASPSPSSAYTITQVAEHNGASSCWSAINGSVYDLTSWISQHPGGEGAILSICGKDGSDAFDNQHGGQGKPERILATFLIGTLAG